MLNRILTISLIFCLSLTFSHTNLFAQANPMDVFKPLVGSWSTTTDIRPSVTIKENTTGTGELTGKLILGGKFLEMTGNGQAPNLGRLEYRMLLTYDERQRTYRRWVFRSDGVTAESMGVWNADQKTITWNAVGLPENVRFTVTTRFTDEGFEETFLGKRADGSISMDITMTSTKKP